VKHLTNEQLLIEYQRAHLQAFEEFYRRHRLLILNFLRLRLGNAGDAEDAFQETFFRIHKYILSYNPAHRALPWSLSIARNVAIDVFKKKATTPISGSIDVDSLSTGQVSNNAKEELDLILKTLNQEEQMILRSRFIEGDSYDEIASALKISVPNARQRLSRLLRKIRSA
jgi:RNA polymerase sigma-70 factor, ECF subfamily